MRSHRGLPLVVFGLALIALSAALHPSHAGAAGINLGWVGTSACPGNSGALVDYVNRCDNTDTSVLVGSVVAPAGLTQVVGEEFLVTFEVSAPSLPDFWRLDAAGCRSGSLLVDAVFTGFATGTGLYQCSDYWGTAARGSVTWSPSAGSSNGAQIYGGFGRSPDSAGPMVAGRQYYVFKAVFDGAHAASPDDPACFGCSIPALFDFCWLRLFQPSGMPEAMISTTTWRKYVTWQGGYGTNWEVGICPGDTPARRATWGQLRSIYR